MLFLAKKVLLFFYFLKASDEQMHIGKRVCYWIITLFLQQALKRFYNLSL